MTLTTHTFIGAVLAKLTGNPLLAFALSFATHYLVDIVPHGDNRLSENFRIKKKKRKEIAAFLTIDACVAIFFILFLIHTRDIESLRTFSWGIAGAILPDLLVGLYDLTRSRFLRWNYRLHFFFHDLLTHRRGDVPLYYSLLAQMVLIAYLQTML